MPTQYSDEARALLAPYVTSLDSPVFVLRHLPEEVVAVLFAYYSRSREDLRTNLLRLLQDQDLDVAAAHARTPKGHPGARAPAPGGHPDDEELSLARHKAREFHEKWVVGYGHASVAEHAVAHVAVEEVSILASKAIEDCRLAAYTEKSTRYVPFPRAYYAAPELEGRAAAAYRGAVEHLFDVYGDLLPRIAAHVAETADRSPFKTERGFLNSCQAQACDALRYLLPAATHTNLGLTANARTLEHMVSKLLSHPLAEARSTGERIREQATRVLPTLIKYARASDYRRETAPAMAALAEELLPAAPEAGTPGGPVRLVHAPPDAEARLAAALLHEAGRLPYEAVWQRVRSLPEEEHRRVIARYLEGRRRCGTAEHGYTDPPLRGLEHLYYTFEIVVDYGAYRDIQRHRMATQTVPRLGCDLGFDMPDLLDRAGFRAPFEAAMQRAAGAYTEVAAADADAAQYVVPLAYRTRVLFTWNLRALHHFISLRSARQGHPSYRRIAQEVHAELERVCPFLAGFIRVDRTDYELARPG